MAGRRMRKAVAEEVILQKMESDPVVVIAGLANEYADYTTTFEEYQAQRYEGASTVYGPNELEAFISQVKRLIQDMAQGVASQTLPSPPTYLSKQISLQPGVIYDSVAKGQQFGDVTVQPPATAVVGEVVSVVFCSADPRNDLRTEGAFFSLFNNTLFE